MSNKKDVLDKKDFFVRYEQGEFGNRLRNWNNIEDLLTDNNPPGSVTIRSTIPGAPTKYNVNLDEMVNEIFWNTNRFAFNESAPDNLLVFQGEIYRGTEHLYMHWSKSKSKMRDALRDSPEKPLFGIALLTHLRYNLSPCDYEWLEYLLDTYDGHTIEFGVYSKNVGVLNSRMIIWEVRKY